MNQSKNKFHIMSFAYAKESKKKHNKLTTATGGGLKQ